MKSGEAQIYASLTGMRAGYMQQQWGRVQMFLVFNIVALPIVFSTAGDEAVKFVISSIDMNIHVFILTVMLRANGWIQLIDRRLRELEQLDQQGPDSLRVVAFSNPEFVRRRNSRFASRRVFAFVGFGFMLIWLERSIRHTLLLLY